MAATTSEDAVTRGRASRGEPIPDGGRVSVLLADPNDGFRSAATTLLHRRGMAIEAVADAGDAPMGATARSPDCVVVDPGVDGEAAIRRAAWLGLHPPVVLATGAPPWALSGTAWRVADAYIKRGGPGRSGGSRRRSEPRAATPPTLVWQRVRAGEAPIPARSFYATAAKTRA